MSDSEIVWMLSAYERDPGDALVGEWPLTDFGEEDARSLFEVPGESDAYGDYPVGVQHVARLQEALDGHRIDLTKWDYFVEATAQP